jgi:hypothetical protein
MSDIITQLKALKLYGMASSYAELRQQKEVASLDWTIFSIS